MPLNRPTASSSLEEWLHWQEHLHPQAIALGLDRVRTVAERIGLTKDGIRTITVAGTNGKGSSAALLSEIYQSAAYSVGAYTSPHLLRYNERIAINGQALSDSQLCAAFDRVEAARGSTALTYFEFGTLAALYLFQQAKVKVQVLEVGMGGRLDAVNIVDAGCALITNIGLDHREFLGKDREQIGFEKAGILRAGRPAVCVDPAPPASVAAQAKAIGARLYELNNGFHFQIVADAWHWRGLNQHYKKLPPPALAGEAQFRNAAGVLMAVTLMREQLPVSESAIRSALVRLHLPGRFEHLVLRSSRRTDCGNVILDVAHNAEAAEVLAANLRAARIGGNVRVVLGMLSDKPVETFARMLAPLTKKFYAGGLPGPRGLDGAVLAGRLKNCGSAVEAHRDVAAAFRAAQTDRVEGDTILVCGSFLTVAAVMEMLGE